MGRTERTRPSRQTKDIDRQRSRLKKIKNKNKNMHRDQTVRPHQQLMNSQSLHPDRSSLRGLSARDNALGTIKPRAAKHLPKFPNLTANSQARGARNRRWLLAPERARSLRKDKSWWPEMRRLDQSRVYTSSAWSVAVAAVGGGNGQEWKGEEGRGWKWMGGNGMEGESRRGDGMGWDGT